MKTKMTHVEFLALDKRGLFSNAIISLWSIKNVGGKGEVDDYRRTQALAILFGIIGFIILLMTIVPYIYHSKNPPSFLPLLIVSLVESLLCLSLFMDRHNVFGTAVDKLCLELRVTFIDLNKADQDRLRLWAETRLHSAGSIVSRIQKSEPENTGLIEAKRNEFSELNRLMVEFSLAEEKWNPKFFVPSESSDKVTR